MYSLRVCRSLFESDPPVHVFTLGAEEIAVENITTSTAGGYVQATLRLTKPTDPKTFPPAAHCEIFWNGGMAFEGLLRRPTATHGVLSALEIAGYGQLLLDHNPWQTAAQHTEIEQPIPMTVAMRMALARQPLIRVSEPFGESWTPA